jgi:uncharacterized membrane protein YgcG
MGVQRRIGRASSTGRLVVGIYAIEPAAVGGSRLARIDASPATDSTPLRLALEPAAADMRRITTEGPEAIEPAPAGDGERRWSLTDAEAVTGRVEEAVNLASALAEGRVVDVAEKLDSLLDLAERLDRDGRYEDELRLARPIVILLCLTLRWVALIMLLRRVLAAARALADADTTAWAVHELGTLAVVAGDDAGGRALLETAQRLRSELGDARGLEATAHNLDALGAATTGRAGRHLPAAAKAVVAALVVLAGAGGAAVAVVVGPGPHHVSTASTGTDTGTGSGSSGSSSSSSGGGGGVGPIVFLKAPTTPTNIRVPAFVFSATGATGYRCTLDDRPEVACDDGAFGSPDDGLPDGPHTFAVHGTGDGRTGPVKSFHWTIDTVAPSITVPKCSASECAYAITGSAGEQLAPPACTLVDARSHEPVDAVVSCTAASASFSGLSEGGYTFTVTDADRAGNLGTASATFFLID